MKWIKFLFVNILNLFLVPFFIFNLFKIRELLRHKDYFLIQDRGGFGHTFIFQDMIRMSFENKRLIFLQFFENKRHNQFLSILFGIKYFYFKFDFQLIFLKKIIRFGKTENNYDVILELLLRIYLRVFYPNTKVIFIKEYYEKIFSQFNNHIGYNFLPFSNSEFMKLKISKSILINNYYFSLLNKYNPELQTQYFNVKYKYLINKYFKNDNSQFLFYVRSKGIDAKEDLLRNGSESEVYKKVFKFLIQNGYKINLIGDWEQLFSNEFNDAMGIKTFKNCNISKNLFDILALINSSKFVGEHGGGQFFATYIRKSMIINGFPYGQKLNNIPILYKNLEPKNSKQKFIDLKKIYLQYDITDDYYISSLNSKMIINYIKKYIIND